MSNHDIRDDCAATQNLFASMLTPDPDRATCDRVRNHLMGCRACRELFDELFIEASACGLLTAGGPSELEMVKKIVKPQDRRLSWLSRLRPSVHIGFSPVRSVAVAAAVVVLAVMLYQRVQWGGALHTVGRISDEGQAFQHSLAKAVTYRDLDNAVSRFSLCKDGSIVIPGLSECDRSEAVTLGKAVRGNRDVRKAYDAAIARWGAAIYEIGDSLVRRGKLPQAADLYQAMHDCKKSPSVDFALAEIRKLQAMDAGRRGDLRSSARYQMQVISIYKGMLRDYGNADPRVRHYLGYAYYQQGRYGDAIVEYNKALKTDPSYAKAWYNLALAWRDRNDVSPAVKREMYDQYLQRAFRLASESYEKGNKWNPQAVFTLAIICAERGLEKQSMDRLGEAIELEPLYIFRGRSEPAFQRLKGHPEYEKLLARDPVERRLPFGLDQGAVYVSGVSE